MQKFEILRTLWKHMNSANIELRLPANSSWTIWIFCTVLQKLNDQSDQLCKADDRRTIIGRQKIGRFLYVTRPILSAINLAVELGSNFADKNRAIKSADFIVRLSSA